MVLDDVEKFWENHVLDYVEDFLESYKVVRSLMVLLMSLPEFLADDVEDFD